ncbi:MAG: o-succinylbenzoate synthase [Bacteroides sp.]|nr:o-succinylbenzoate synthase [Bacteroides sp.]MCM1457704.1 o-succinylbenzoate synthase [Lachnoclostridium sp.]
MRFSCSKYRLYFRFEARTSRAVMRYKDTYFIEGDGVVAECPLFAGLSADDVPDYERQLMRVCSSGLEYVPDYSSIIFGVESMRRLLENPVNSSQSWSVPINGLVWMGDKRLMQERVEQKLAEGFRCIKLKIGGIDFADELDMVASLRSRFSPSDLEIRLDANGAFTPDNAIQRLDALSRHSIHSLEQPVKAGQWQAMERICRESPIPIALDEELIGVRSDVDKASMLDAIRPQYIILKPALCGGFAHSDAWIAAAQDRGIGWWATSALESNVGLAAIGSWLTSKYEITLPQGLGTGALYTNNIPAPLTVASGRLFFG